ncbi:hypothetical protein ACKUV4_000080 [Acinetobacter baumannii]
MNKYLKQLLDALAKNKQKSKVLSLKHWMISAHPMKKKKSKYCN